MPIIAPGAHLTAIATQLNAGLPVAARELRAQGNNLYVKTGSSCCGGSATNRAAHQTAAVALLRGGLEHQYGLTPLQATAVMTNVFQGAPTEVTVGDMNRLDQFAQQTGQLMNGATTAPQAFELAQRIQDAVMTGTPPAQAARVGVAASWLLGPHADLPRAWDLGDRVRQLEAGGMAALDARAQGRTAADLIHVTPALPPQTAMNLAAEVQGAIRLGADPGAALAQGQVATALVTGHNATPAHAFALAGQIDAAVAGGMAGPAALLQAQAACAILAGAPATTPAHAFALAGLADAAVVGGTSRPTAMARAQTAAALLAAAPGTTPAHAFALGKEVSAAVSAGTAQPAAMLQAQAACALLAAVPGTTPAQAFGLATAVDAAVAGGMTQLAATQQAEVAGALLLGAPDVKPKQAFALVGLADAAVAGGMAQPAATQQATTACALLAAAPSATPAHAFAVAQLVEAAVINGTARPAAVMQGQAAAALLAGAVSAGGAVPMPAQAHATVAPMVGRASAAVLGGMSTAMAASHAAGACALAAGGIADAQAFSLGACAGAMAAGGAPPAAVLRLALAAVPLLAAAPSAKAAMVQAVRAETAALPVFDLAMTPAHRQTWLELGRCCGAAKGFEAVDRQTIPLGERASMLSALGHDTFTQLNAAPLGAKGHLQALSNVGRSCTVADLTPASEVVRLAAFHGAVAGSAQIQAGRLNWGTLSHDQRIPIVRAVMTLHAQHLGYDADPPGLRRAALGPGMLGFYSPVANEMTIDMVKPQFASFPSMFNTIVHESTHAYQKFLTDELAQGRVGPGDDRHLQARIFEAGNVLPLTTAVLGLAGVTGRSADSAYRTAPVERHAFHHGDAAEALVTP